jgi:hypothetical protein
MKMKDRRRTEGRRTEGRRTEESEGRVKWFEKKKAS